MSVPVDEPPVVGLDRTHTQTYAQAVMALGWLLRDRRQQRGKRAWSEAEDAALAHDEAEDLLRHPPVRQVTPAEARETTGWADSRSVTNQEDELEVRIRPTEAGRWVLEAEIVPLQPATSTDTMRLQVSCDTEARARDLAAELAAAGPDRDLLARLTGHTQRTDQRRRAARHDTVQDHEQWLRTVAEAAQEAWSPEIAEAVSGSAAFGILAQHVQTLADRGYAPADVLRRIPEADLARPTTRDAGALAGWFAANLTDQLVVVEADPSHTPDATPSQRPGAGATGPVLRDIPRQDVDRAAAEELVRTAAPDVAEQLVGCRAWPTLARTIHDGIQAGQPVERMLASFPHEAIARARKPAAYATRLLQRSLDDQHQAAAARAGRPWPPSPRPRSGSTPVEPAERLGDLDPTSAVDRVVLDAAHPSSGPVDPAAAASHNDAAEDAEAAADRAERDAGYERTHPDVTGTPGGSGAATEDSEPERIDDLAAGYHATAAAEHSSASAALRAEVPFTPAARADAPGRPAHPSRPHPAPARALTRHPRRHR